MKNNKNRKKVLPLLLAMLLLIGAGAYGTRAFFSDQEALKATIKIETGKLDISSISTEEWKYVPLADETIDKAYILNNLLKVSSVVGGATITPNASGQSIGSTVYISNARPGDAFTRVFKFKNAGTLDLRMTFTTDLAAVTSDDFIVTFTNGNDAVKILAPGEEVSYTLTISVRTGSTNTNGLNPHVLDYILKHLTIVATQPNAK